MDICCLGHVPIKQLTMASIQESQDDGAGDLSASSNEPYDEKALSVEVHCRQLMTKVMYVALPTQR